MDRSKRRGMAHSGYEGEDGTDYSLYLIADEVDFVWQWEQGEDTPEQAEISMSVTDLKRLIKAAQHLLKMTKNDTPLPVEYPESDEI